VYLFSILVIFAQWLNSAGTSRNAIPSCLVGVPPLQTGVPVPPKNRTVINHEICTIIELPVINDDDDDGCT